MAMAAIMNAEKRLIPRTTQKAVRRYQGLRTRLATGVAVTTFAVTMSGSSCVNGEPCGANGEPSAENGDELKGD